MSVEKDLLHGCQGDSQASHSSPSTSLYHVTTWSVSQYPVTASSINVIPQSVVTHSTHLVD